MTDLIQPKRLHKLFQRLVDIYSPSGKEEQIVDYLHGYLRRKGLPAKRQRVDDTRHNLMVLPKNGEAQLAFVGHLDTVTAYDLEHYGFEEKGDEIAGLGTADMKGGCAAMVEAYLGLWERNPGNLPVALALVVGEEEDGDGAERLLEDYRFPWAVVGEPTDLQPCLSNYGYMEVQVCTTGTRKHASRVERANNPVESMLHLLLRVADYIASRRPELVYNIRDLFTARAGFVVPDRCEAWLDLHLPPESPMGEILMELEELLANNEQKKGSGISAGTTIRFDTLDGGYALPARGPVVKALKKLYGRRKLPWNPQPFQSHSDANQLWAGGVKPILLGPGHLDKAHAPDESVSFPQVCLAAEIYQELALALTGT